MNHDIYIYVDGLIYDNIYNGLITSNIDRLVCTSKYICVNIHQCKLY
jgi:hypothetical protein